MAASTGPTSTFRTYLMYKDPKAVVEPENYSKLIDIKTAPDTGGTPNMLETTTMSDKKQTFVDGVEQTGDGYQFTANYTLDNYKKLKSLKGINTKFALFFGGTGVSTASSDSTITGDDGIFPFEGTLSAYVTGSGVDEVREITITIAPNIAMELDESLMS